MIRRAACPSSAEANSAGGSNMRRPLTAKSSPSPFEKACDRTLAFETSSNPSPEQTNGGLPPSSLVLSLRRQGALLLLIALLHVPGIARANQLPLVAITS